MCQHQKGYNTFDLTINGIPVCERVEKKTCNAGYSDFLISCQDYAFDGCARPREPSMDPLHHTLPSVMESNCHFYNLDESRSKETPHHSPKIRTRPKNEQKRTKANTT